MPVNRTSHRLRVSLKIAHPSLDPGEISNILGLTPKLTRCVGEVRKTPTGQLLVGVNQETYWLHEFEVQDELDSEESLAAIVSVLESRAVQIRELVVSGAALDLSVGLFIQENTSLELNQKLMGALASLGIGVTLSIYAPEEDRNERTG